MLAECEISCRGPCRPWWPRVYPPLPLAPRPVGVHNTSSLRHGARSTGMGTSDHPGISGPDATRHSRTTPLGLVPLVSAPSTVVELQTSVSIRARLELSMLIRSCCFHTPTRALVVGASPDSNISDSAAAIRNSPVQLAHLAHVVRRIHSCLVDRTISQHDCSYRAIQCLVDGRSLIDPDEPQCGPIPARRRFSATVPFDQFMRVMGRVFRTLNPSSPITGPVAAFNADLGLIRPCCCAPLTELH